MIPNDAFLLLSYMNTKLRDEYDSLAALCEGEDVDEAELTEKLAGIGYNYRADLNKFC